MAPSFCAEGPFVKHSWFQVQLRFEPLEDRDLLSVTQPVDADGSQAELADAEPTDASIDIDWDLWQDIFSEPDGAADPVIEDEPLPIIPPDETVGPRVECPGLDEDFCLPGEIEINFDFDDFLMFQQNFGMENATYQDGDLDGDGVVGFGDFVILAQYFG
jgi:hypothetical protein